MQQSKSRDAGSEKQQLRTDSCPESSKPLQVGDEVAVAVDRSDNIILTPADASTSVKVLCAVKLKQTRLNGASHKVTRDDERNCTKLDKDRFTREKCTTPKVTSACGASKKSFSDLIPNGNGTENVKLLDKKDDRAPSAEEKGIQSLSSNRNHYSLWPPRSLQDCFSSTTSGTDWAIFGKKEVFDESSPIKDGNLYAGRDSVQQTRKAGWFFPAFALPRALPPLTVGDPLSLDKADVAPNREKFENESRTRYLFSWYPLAVENELLDRCKVDVSSSSREDVLFSKRKIQNRISNVENNSSVQQQELNVKAAAKDIRYKFSSHISNFASWLVQKVRSCFCIATTPGKIKVTLERGSKIRLSATAVLKQISFSRVLRQWLALFPRYEKHTAVAVEAGSHFRNLNSNVVVESVTFTTPEGGYLLWCSSWCLIINPLAAFYFQCYRLGTLSSIVFVTSIFHWRKPQFGWRRNVDLLAVFTASSIHIVAAILYSGFFFRFVYVIFFSTGILCYIMGIVLASVGFHWEAALSHLGLHLLCTLGNVLLYNAVAL